MFLKVGLEMNHKWIGDDALIKWIVMAWHT